LQTQDHAYRSPDDVRFLRALLCKIQGKLLTIWGGATIHRDQPLKDFLARGTAKRMPLAQLSAYAPELNPVEGLWTSLKRVELGNRCCANAPTLGLELRRGVRLSCLAICASVSKVSR
jgi:transposase